MGAGLGALAAAVAIYYAAPLLRLHSLLPLAGRICLTLALILYPLASSSAVGLLVCVATPTTPTALASLDGGGDTSASGGSVSVLVSNPYFVCWRGTHSAAGAFAAAALALYVAALPVLSILWAWRAAERERAAAAEAEAHAKGPETDSSEGAPQSPMPWANADPVVRPLVADYVIAAW